MDLRDGRQAYLVAVDPHVIPLGTRLRISPNPFGNPNIVFTAADTGGAIKGDRIDFYDWRGRQAQNQWGSRNVKVDVVSGGTAAPAPSTSGAGYPGLRVDPGVDVQDVNPTLLQRLSKLAQDEHVTVEVFSGYRNSGIGGQAGLVGDPHSRGLAADVNVNGQPIANALGWQTVEHYGLRSGSDPSLQPFYRGGADPAHVDLMDASGTRPAPGLSYPFGGGFGLPPTTVDFWGSLKGIVAGSGGTIATAGGGTGMLVRSGGGIGGGKFQVVDPTTGQVISSGNSPLDAAKAESASVIGFLENIGKASFWIRVLEVGGGGIVMLLGLAIIGRSLTSQQTLVTVAEGARTLRNATPGRRRAESVRRSAPRTRASTVRDYGTTRAPSASHLREAEKERRIRDEDQIPF